MDQTNMDEKGLNWALTLRPSKPKMHSHPWALPKTLGITVTGDKPTFTGILGSPFSFSLLIHRTISSRADKDKDVSVRGKQSIMGKGGKMLSGQQLTLRSH